MSKRSVLAAQEQKAAELAWKQAAVAQLAKLEAVRNPTPAQVEEMEYLRLEIAQDAGK